MIKRTYKERTKKRELLVQKIIALGILAFFLFIMIFCSIIIWRKFHGGEISMVGKEHTKMIDVPEIQEELLTPNQYSRPQLPLKTVNGIVVHYTANPKSDAMDNRNYFENLKDTHITYASSHFIIGLDGTIIQCIPLDEMAYASNDRNSDTISIECCHNKKNGAFTDETYESLVKLVAWLCGEYDLDKEDIIRHYDVTGKNCPKYYVEHEELWEAFKQEVFVYIDTYGVDVGME